MAVYENLICFLKNGKLENINFGVSKENLIEILGEPKDISRHSYADIYRYGDFEFYILKESWKDIKSERLFGVLTYASDSSPEYSSFVFDVHGWTKKLTIDEAILFLDDHQINFEEKNEFDEADVRSLYTESEVFIQFRDWNENGNFNLYKFGRTIELQPMKPPTKQISFEIEATFYEQLRKTAEKTKNSIANQCREIIEKHLENN